MSANRIYRQELEASEPGVDGGELAEEAGGDAAGTVLLLAEDVGKVLVLLPPLGRHVLQHLAAHALGRRDRILGRAKGRVKVTVWSCKR